MSPQNKHPHPTHVSVDHMAHGDPGHQIQVNPCFSVPSKRSYGSFPQPQNSSASLTKEQKKDRSGKLIIGEGIIVLCEIKSCKSLFVHGGIETSVKCEALKISETGELIGDAVVNEADVYGLFKGDLTVKGLLTVHVNGRVLGKISYGNIKIKRGGIVSGYVKETSDADASNSLVCSTTFSLDLSKT